MSAKVRCKKGYNINEGYVEFKMIGGSEYCPASNADCCEECKASVYKSEVVHNAGPVRI